jgi:hypothetical protein
MDRQLPSKGEYVPTDEEFLDSLYSHPAKSRAAGLRNPEFVREAAEALSNAKAIPENTDAEQFVRDLFNPRKDFRGPKIARLRVAAARHLAPEEQYLLDTPIGYLHTEELNGCAVRTPRGGAVILLDLGVLLHMHRLGCSVMSLCTWSSPEPFCRDHEPVAFVHTIVSLARYALSYDDRYLAGITTWNCPSLGKWDLQSAQFAGIAELFVLLHEYGHILSGHLDAAKVADNTELPILVKDHAQEYQADAVGFDRLTRQIDVMTASPVVLILFRFLDLIEHLRYGAPRGSNTHPPARERWLRLSEGINLTEEGKEWSRRIESLFDMILGEASKIPPATSSRPTTDSS